MSAPLPEHIQWLIKAEHDLKSARLLANAEDPLWDTAVYHCQQVAEKCLKAVLSYHRQHVRRTHDLTALLETCITLNSTFDELREAAEDLTPYATFFRYPGDLLEPDPDDVTLALAQAGRPL